jgi:uncharacterized membrane protein
MTGGTMTGIDYFAWLVLIVIIVSVVVAFVGLAKLPGQTATKRGHPQATAINVAGWLGMLLSLGAFWLVVVWALALVWAFASPIGSPAHADGDVERLEARIAELEGERTSQEAGS